MSSLATFGRGPENATESNIILTKLQTTSTLTIVICDLRSLTSLTSTCIILYLPLSFAAALGYPLYVARSGCGDTFNYCPWCQLHIVQNRVINNQGRFLGGCVTEWGKAVSDVKRSVLKRAFVPGYASFELPPKHYLTTLLP